MRYPKSRVLFPLRARVAFVLLCGIAFLVVHFLDTLVTKTISTNLNPYNFPDLENIKGDVEEEPHFVLYRPDAKEPRRFVPAQQHKEDDNIVIGWIMEVQAGGVSRDRNLIEHAHKASTTPSPQNQTQRRGETKEVKLSEMLAQTPRNTVNRGTQLGKQFRKALFYPLTSSVPLPEPVFPSLTGSKPLLIDMVHKANRDQVILNQPPGGLKLEGNTSVVILVQVHARVEYLKLLIQSLSKVKGIHQALLIFSHDLFLEQVDAMIRSVTFCPLMQIYYPYSSQLYPGGKSRMDFRLTNVTQAKHHWFWKVNHVFDNLQITAGYNGPVLFIEEDHYLAPDAIHMIRKMYQSRPSLCPECGFFALAQRIISTPEFYPAAAHMVLISPNIPSYGLTFDRAQWVQIRSCAEDFCRMNDYNWDWTLLNVARKCMPNPQWTLVLVSPRISHLGVCGMHSRSTNCDPGFKLRQTEAVLAAGKDHFFPERLTLIGDYHTFRPKILPQLFEGWNDVRDHALCYSYLRPDSHS